MSCLKQQDRVQQSLHDHHLLLPLLLLLLLLLLLQITKLEVEAGGGLTCSAADNILSLL
jgi:hypothetical protein